MAAGIITPLPPESEEKVHYSAGSCNNTSHSNVYKPQCSQSFISTRYIFFLPFFSLSLTQIKHSLPLPPPPRLVLQHTAAELMKKTFKKEVKKPCQYDSSFPPYLTGSSRSCSSRLLSGAKGDRQCLSDRELHRSFSFSLCDWS